MADPDSDQLVTLSELAVLLRNRRIIVRDRKTLHRWATAGVRRGSRRVVLRTETVANVRHSTLSWVMEFIQEQSGK